MKKKHPLKDALNETKKKFMFLQEKINSLKKIKSTSLEDEIIGITKNAPETKKITLALEPASVAKSTAVILLLILLFFFLYQINGILVLFFVSFLFAAALDPIVKFFQTRKVPRSVSVLIIYLLFFLGAGLFLSSLVPLIAKQVLDIGQTVGEFVRKITTDNSNTFPFADQLKPYIQQIYQAIDIKTAALQLQSTLKVVADQLVSVSFGLINVLLVLILTFFMTVEEKAMEEFYLSLFPMRYGKYISTRLDIIKAKVGYWLRGQLLLSLVAIILSYIGLLILNVNYALTLSVVSGITMLIPVIGRTFAWVLTMPIVLNQSPILALWVSIYYLILQQIENNVLVPYIMNKAVGLSPIIIIFSMLVGSQYLGILGLVISIPIATMLAIFVKDYTERAK